ANVAPDGNYANVAPDGNYVSAAFGADYADGHTRAVVPEGSVASEAFAAAQTDDGGAAESFSRYAAAVLTAEKTPMSIKASETPTGERQASGETAKPLSPGEKPPEAGLFVKQSGVKPDWQAEIKEIRFQAPGQTATRLKEMTEGFLRPVIRENSEIRELLANVKSEQPQVPAPKTDAVEARLKYDAAQTLEARFLAGGADATQGADKGVSDGFRAAAQTFEAIMDRISAFKGRAGATSFELTLNPEKLGRLVIKLVLKDNAVTVRIIADNARTRELLAGRAGIVRESLEQSGVTVERYEVTQSTKAVYREFSDDGGGKNRQGYDEDGQDDGNDEEGELSFAEIVGAMI
ncbi:MAG: flagellar hook-length control protein FliK, partial [Oscillospiraceae bacterium]|nr:flagellar hook-length control protein FliK [Oscillospiraceae bacterium]